MKEFLPISMHQEQSITSCLTFEKFIKPQEDETLILFFTVFGHQKKYSETYSIIFFSSVCRNYVRSPCRNP